jgi:hypothetical protein
MLLELDATPISVTLSCGQSCMGLIWAGTESSISKTVLRKLPDLREAIMGVDPQEEIVQAIIPNGKPATTFSCSVDMIGRSQ